MSETFRPVGCEAMQLSRVAFASHDQLPGLKAAAQKWHLMKIFSFDY